MCGAERSPFYVKVTTGDQLIAFKKVSPPNVIKIDVEGFELEVLQVLEHTLRSPQCRAVFVEVHFGILDRRGDRYAPLKVASLLQGAGHRTRWVDASHIAAERTISE